MMAAFQDTHSVCRSGGDLPPFFFFLQFFLSHKKQFVCFSSLNLSGGVFFTITTTNNNNLQQQKTQSAQFLLVRACVGVDLINCRKSKLIYIFMLFYLYLYDFAFNGLYIRFKLYVSIGIS